MKKLYKYLYSLLLIILVLSIISSSAIRYAETSENVRVISRFGNLDTHNIIARDTSTSEKYIKQVTFVKQDANTLMDEYAYLAAIPNSIYYDTDGIKYISPMLYGTSDIERYYLEDWSAYLNGWPGTTVVHFVGDYSADFRDDVLSYFDNSDAQTYSGDSAVQIAKEIAVNNWIKSDYAVLAPIDTSLDYSSYTGSFTEKFSDISSNYVNRSVTYDYNTLYFSFGYLAESPHPYYNNMNENYTVHINNAVAISLHFDKIDVEQNFDYVKVYDKQWNLIVEYTGYYEDVWTPDILGDTVHIVLDTDSSVTAWGFGVDCLIYSTPAVLTHDGDSFSYDFYVGSSVNYVMAYIYTNETSSTDSLIGVYLKDPTGRVVDYSIVPGSERYSRSMDPDYYEVGYNDRLFWLNNMKGYYTITFEAIDIPDNCAITVFSEIRLYNATNRYTINVPKDAVELTASLDVSNDDYLGYARVGLIDPYGNWIFGNIYDSESFNDMRITVPYPVEGKWTIVAYCNPSDYLDGKSTEYKVNYSIKTKSYSAEALESAANAAIYASLRNAPLLYTKPNEVPDSTMDTLALLNVKTVYLIDPYNLVSNNVVSYLENKGYSVVEIASPIDLISAIRQLSNTDNLVISLGDNGLFSPAALLATYHGCPVILFENNDGKRIIGLDKATWGRFWYSEWYEYYYCGLIEDWRYAHFYWMKHLSDEFFNWLKQYNLHPDDITYTTIIAPTSKISALLERAILGGVYPGRLPARDQIEASAMVSRTITYNAVIFENPGKNKITESLIAYHVGWWIVDNDGVTRTVDDYKITETTDYKMEFHIGEDEIFSALNEGTLVWYYADHGGLGYNYWNYVPGGPGVLAVPYNDTDWRAYESGGDATTPDTDGDGVVNPTDILVREIWGTELDSRLENVHSTLAIFMACYVGSSEIPEIILRHGGIASFANLRTLYFGYGYVTATFLNYLYLGKTLGEAYFESVNATSYNYYRGTVSRVIGYYDSVLGSDSFIRYPLFGGVSVQYVLFGDPSIKLLTATANEPAPISPSSLTADNHSSYGTIKRSIGLTITSPQEGALVNDSFTVEWNVSIDYTILKNVTLYIDNVSYDVTGKTSLLVNVTTIEDGNHTITVIAFDVAENKTSDSTWVIIDKTAPEISIIEPSNNQNVSGVVYILWSVHEENLKSVTLMINESVFDVTGRNYFEWNTTKYANGSYTITISAEDNAGNTASRTIHVVVNNLQAIESQEPQTSTSESESEESEFNITTVGTGMGVGFILGAVLALAIGKRKG